VADDPIGVAREVGGLLAREARAAYRDLSSRVRNAGAEAMRSLRGDRIRSYEAASLGRRMSGIRARATDADAEIAAAGPYPRDRARYFDRNSPHAHRIIVEFASDLVSDGIFPEPMTGADKTDRQWLECWEDFAHNCDSLTQGTIYGLQFQWAAALCRDGGYLVRRRWRRPEDGLPIPLQVQGLEIDHLDTTKDGGRGHWGATNRIVGGVELTPFDRRAGYHLFRDHPGAASRGLAGITYAPGESVPVPADEILHVYGYTTGRVGQVQGMTWLHAVLARLWDFDGWVDATMLARRIAASPAMWVEDGDPDCAPDGVDGVGPVGIADQQGKVVDGHGYPIESVEPGIVGYLPGGKRVKPASQPSVPDHETATRVTLREIMAGALTPYESGTGDLSQVSFISGRMGYLSRNRLVDAIREQVFVPLTLRPLASWVTDAAVLRGRLPARKGGWPVNWPAPRREEADELTRIKTVAAKVRSGLKTPQQALSEEGIPLDKFLADWKAWRQLTQDLGLTFDSDPNSTTGAGVWQQGTQGGNNEQQLSRKKSGNNDAGGTNG